MANYSNEVSQNVPGRFYVDDSCIYCDLCVLIAPTIFRDENFWGYASVFHQPITPEDVLAAIEALEGCPTESIGKDGSERLPSLTD